MSVVLALPENQQVISLTVAPGCTARQAVQAAMQAGLDCSVGGVNPDSAPLGVFGERVGDEVQLSDGDRVEIYRPLKQNPMELRRRRAALEFRGLSKRRK